MAKRRRRHTIHAPSFTRPPSPEERLGYAADEFARVAAEANPATQRLRDSIRARALKAAKAKK